MTLTNPVLITVVMLLVLCFLRVNVLLALLTSTVTTNLVVGMGVSTIMTTSITGIDEDPEMALSYVMLGGLAAIISYTGVSNILAVKIAKLINGKSLAFVFSLGFISCFSQNPVPVYTAFIPILIPPLLIVMNRMKINRGAMAYALAFDLRALYVAIPARSGLIYHNVVSNNMTKDGMEIDKIDVWHYTQPLDVAVLIGSVLIVLFLYRKPRGHKNVEGFVVNLNTIDTTMTFKHWSVVIIVVVTPVIQLVRGPLLLSVLTGSAITFITKVVKRSNMDKIIDEDVQLMGFIAFAMPVSNGFSAVLHDSGGVDQPIQSSLDFIGDSKLLDAFIMTLVDLFIVMGTSTPFGTVPVLTILYIPFCAQLGFNIGATTFLIAVTATIGDTGSPVSDATLGPTARLNADRQHDHVWDTCVPIFIAPDIPISILAIIALLLT